MSKSDHSLLAAKRGDLRMGGGESSGMLPPIAMPDEDGDDTPVSDDELSDSVCSSSLSALSSLSLSVSSFRYFQKLAGNAAFIALM